MSKAERKPSQGKEGLEQRHSVLVADNDAASRQILTDLFQTKGYNVTEAKTGPEVLAAVVKPGKPNLVILDMQMPELSGFDVLRRMRDMDTGIGVIALTAHWTSNLAIQSVQLGAYDYFTKPFDPDEIATAATRYFENLALKKEAQPLRALGRQYPGELMVGRHPSMLKIYNLIGRIAASDTSILVTGDTGTGKELVAEEIHRHSHRRNGPLIKVAIAGLAETLVESELFGHEKGSFTSAYTQRIGRFELADRGTLFLDEIGEMTAWTQKRLLRVLQESEFERVGGTKTIKVDVRVIAATNRNLAEDVAKGNFRSDLYYRIKMGRIHLPPLRDRREDIPLLIEHFLAKYRLNPQDPLALITSDAIALLERHEWPGNIRQLENVIRWAVDLSQGKLITPEHLDLEP